MSVKFRILNVAFKGCRLVTFFGARSVPVPQRNGFTALRLPMALFPVRRCTFSLTEKSQGLSQRLPQPKTKEVPRPFSHDLDLGPPPRGPSRRRGCPRPPGAGGHLPADTSCLRSGERTRVVAVFTDGCFSSDSFKTLNAPPRRDLGGLPEPPRRRRLSVSLICFFFKRLTKS